jgi:uncharacterized protein (UPF0548 family)
MTINPQHGKFVFFGLGGTDTKYLDLWRNVPLRYVPGQKTDSTWHTDDHEEIITHDPDGVYFERAADLLMRYHFYPETLLSHTSDFSLQDRWVRPGDRIVQRITALRLLGFPILQALTMNEIYAVIDEPRRKGFTYVTTEAHIEMGEWSPKVEWRENGDLVLTIHVHSRLAYDLPLRFCTLIRRFQLRAHDAGIETFKKRVLV